MQYINEDQVESVLDYAQLIPLLRQTMIDFSSGRINQPTRRLFETGYEGGFFGSMPAASPQSLGAKLLAVYPNNAQRNRHTHMAVIMLFNPETGEPLVMMDGRLITEMRTAAVSAAFIEATTDNSVQCLAMIGAGVQANSHLQALTQIRSFTDIRIHNRNRDRGEPLAETFRARLCSCEQAVRDADVVIVATSSTEPVIDGHWLKPGARVVSVGWSGPDGCELDAHTLSHQVIVDSREGAQTESGNIRRHQPTISGELGELLSGKLAFNADDTLVFDSIGMACQDVATAMQVYQQLQG